MKPAEVIDEWAAIYADTLPPYLGKGERDTSMIRQENGGIDWSYAHRLINKWIAAGKIEYVGKRRNKHGQTVDAWRCKSVP